MSTRAGKRILLAVLACAAIACATPVPFRYSQLPGFVPHDEHLQYANRRVFVADEGPGQLATGEPLYYIAYVTSESIPHDRKKLGGFDPLWGEIQALWVQRRETLDPAAFRYVVIDARSMAGVSGYETRRTVFVSLGDSWQSMARAQFVLDE